MRNRLKGGHKNELTYAALTVFALFVSCAWVGACASGQSLADAAIFPEAGVCGVVRCVPTSKKKEESFFGPEELKAFDARFCGEIQSIDDTVYPDLDFIVQTRSMPGQSPLAAGSIHPCYRHVRIRRKFQKDKSEEFNKTNILIRHALSGDDEIKKLEFIGRFRDGSSDLNIGVDGFLDLTAIFFYFKDPKHDPPAGGYAFEGVISTVFGCRTMNPVKR